jgi:hypothetical protein
MADEDDDEDVPQEYVGGGKPQGNDSASRARLHKDGERKAGRVRTKPARKKSRDDDT